ncbi:hypothetical protein QQ045_010721 [Rhodiola kirilowii]
MAYLYHKRRWMYEARAHGELYTNDVFIAGVNNFIETVVSKGFLVSDNTIHCPCRKRKNWRFINIRMMEEHLYKYDFTPNYFNWTLHDEDLAEMQYVNTCPTIPEPTTIDRVLDSKEEIWSHTAFPEMVPNFASPADIPESSNFGEHQSKNLEANRFFNLLNSSSEPASEGCTTETELSINMKMLVTKAHYGLSEGAFNTVCGTMKNLIGGGGRIRSHLLSSSQKNL